MVKLSVIVPVYNTEKYLKRCLQSIINQTLKEIEIIVVNDGSLDNSVELIREFQEKDSRIKLINKENGGLSSARNAGIKKAQGKYLINIDSDDWIEQNYFEDMYLKAENDKLDIVVSDIFWDYDNGRVKYISDLKLSEDSTIDNEEYLELFFKGNIYPAVWNKMYKTDLYKCNNILHPEGISLGEDFATTPCLALKAKKIGKINKAYVHYIQNNNSLTNSNPTKKIYELIKVYNLLEKNLSDDQRKKMNNLKINNMSSLIFNLNYDICDNFYKDGLQYYCDLFKNNFIIKGKTKKLEICFRILKQFPNIKTLKLIYYFNKIIKKWKK